MATSKIGMHREEGSSAQSLDRTVVVTGSAPGPDDVLKDDVLRQLDKILASSSFKNSRRHTQFLRFVVELALAGRHSEIKERLIGIEIFDRPPTYDLATDSIARGAAVELRKRIATYYADPNHGDELRIELPLGSYVPTFHWPSHRPNLQHELEAVEFTASKSGAQVAPVAAEPHPQHGQTRARQGRRWFAILTALALLCLISSGFAVYTYYANSNQRALNAFWAPLMNGGQTITVCVGDLNYMFETPPFNKVLEVHPTASNLLNPNAGAALLRVGIILGSRGKRTTLRFADRTELNDLRQQPVIFIGGLNNPWTQRVLTDYRFRLANRPGGIGGQYSLVVDQMNPTMTTWRTDIFAPLNSITRDYSLVTRINDPLTGEPVVILCGLGPYGTAAASEFVSNPNYFSEFSKQAPAGWENRNIQIVLETTVVDGRVSVPRVVAEQIY